MKIIMKTKIISVLLFLFTILSFTGCSQDVMFYDIAREVKLVNPEIIGNVYSIVACDGKLYVQNGNIYEKSSPASSRGWSKIDKPEGSGSIIRLAADSSYLYAMNTERTVWAKSSGSSTWTQIETEATTIFDNQKVGDSDFSTLQRCAYIVKGTSCLLLNGTESPSSSPASGFLFGSDIEDIRTIVPVEASYYWSCVPHICSIGSNLYAIDGTTLKYSTDIGTTWTPVSVSGTPTCLCTYGTDKLLVGTSSGYQIFTIDASGAPTNGRDSSTNAESAFGTREIITIKAFGTSVYAAVVSENTSEYSKLWGYFNSVWNYE